MKYGHFLILSSLSDEERTREYKKLMQGICFQENDVTKSHRHGIPGNYMTDAHSENEYVFDPSDNNGCTAEQVVASTVRLLDRIGVPTEDNGMPLSISGRLLILSESSTYREPMSLND